MEITQVKIFPVEEEKLKAYVSIVLDDCFLVSDLSLGCLAAGPENHHKLLLFLLTDPAIYALLRRDSAVSFMHLQW